MNSASSSADEAALLRQLTGDPKADFRPDQLDAIRRLTTERSRVLLVQRTGWGKSAVYFIATKLLRSIGSGPTLIVSPLLALMRNQIQAAQRMGVEAVTINSDNRSEWDGVTQRIEDDGVDLVLISPERLANQDFRRDVLPMIGQRCGLLVIDEAHCISDWGHDFRPDYRRLLRVLELLPRGVPVLCCTATANDRVVDDVTSQLGSDFAAVRGALARDGLRLHAITMNSPAERLAWLAAAVERLPGTGVIYCSTVRDTERVANWLRSRGVEAVAYSGSTDRDARPEIEQALLSNAFKVVVATSALGMGFDKPDLSFVIHYQSPGSPVAYYQQVGRAGRGLRESWGVMLRGSEDSDIQEHFINNAFAEPELAQRVVALLDADHEPMGLVDLLSHANVRQSRLEGLLKNLEVDGAVERSGQRWQRTLQPWQFDFDRAEAVTALRYAELEQVQHYIESSECRMQMLRRFLDDPVAEPCGRCDNCTGESLALELDPAQVQEAAEFMRSAHLVIEPRKQWPDRKRIPAELWLAEGRVLARWGDAGWGSLVRTGKQDDGRFDDRLVDAAAELLRERWRPQPAPTWLTFVPSHRHPELVADFAERLASRLDLPCHDSVVKAGNSRPQKMMQNSLQQHRNVESAFAARGAVPEGPVLLIDDVVDSRWTLTVVGQVLRKAGAGAVIPLALADTSEGAGR